MRKNKNMFYSFHSSISNTFVPLKPVCRARRSLRADIYFPKHKQFQVSGFHRQCFKMSPCGRPSNRGPRKEMRGRVCLMGRAIFTALMFSVHIGTQLIQKQIIKDDRFTQTLKTYQQNNCSGEEGVRAIEIHSQICKIQKTSDSFMCFDVCIHIQQYNIYCVLKRSINKSTNVQTQHVCSAEIFTSCFSLKSVVISVCGVRSTGSPYRKTWGERRRSRKIKG